MPCLRWSEAARLAKSQGYSFARNDPYKAILSWDSLFFPLNVTAPENGSCARIATHPAQVFVALSYLGNVATPKFSLGRRGRKKISEDGPKFSHGRSLLLK